MKTLIQSFIPPSLLRRWRIIRNGRFRILLWETSGLLPETMYQILHDHFLDTGDKDIVEIGGASGTASIAIAMALKKSKSKSRLVVVEKFEGGTRSAFGGHSDNLSRFQHFMRLYEVEDYIRLWDGYLTEGNSMEVRKLVRTDSLAGMMIDADGRIHRDLSAFWDLITPDTRIFIDDVHPTLSTKHELTYRIVQFLLDEKVLAEERHHGTTYLFRRSDAAPSTFPWAECQDIYNSYCEEKHLVFDKRGIIEVHAPC